MQKQWSRNELASQTLRHTAIDVQFVRLYLRVLSIRHYADVENSVSSAAHRSSGRRRRPRIHGSPYASGRRHVTSPLGCPIPISHFHIGIPPHPSTGGETIAALGAPKFTDFQMINCISSYMSFVFRHIKSAVLISNFKIHPPLRVPDARIHL